MSLFKLLFPAKCPFCGSILSEEMYEQMGCCATFRHTRFFRKHTPCAAPESLSEVLDIYCPLVYAGPVKAAIIRYKFGGENWMKQPFSRILHRYLTENDGYRYCEYITAVPITGRRFRARGYNQAEAIAKQLSVLSGIPYGDFLERKERIGEGQTSKMNRQNRLSVKRFQLSRNILLPKNAGILLVDDILTTGSTVHECARLLLQGGAGFIKVAVLASGRRDLGGMCA